MRSTAFEACVLRNGAITPSGFAKRGGLISRGCAALHPWLLANAPFGAGFVLVMVVVMAGCASRQVVTTAPATGPGRIDRFAGEYRFLSNFYPATVVYEGITYPDSEHAYQSAKTLDMKERRRIAGLGTAAEAKKAGEALVYRADWEQVKYEVMLECVRDKFTRNGELRKKLLATGEAYLEEGNTWGDRVWGVYEGEGTNWLGKVLMQVRGELRRG